MSVCEFRGCGCEAHEIHKRINSQGLLITHAAHRSERACIENHTHTHTPPSQPQVALADVLWPLVRSCKVLQPQVALKSNARLGLHLHL